MTPTSDASPNGAGSAAVRPAPADSREALARARELTATLAPSGAAIDLAAADPADALDLLARSGLAALAVPSELGGLWEGPGWVGVGPLLHAMIEIAAGDGSVGQVWSQSLGTACVLFTSPSLPEQARSTLAQELLHHGRRLVTSNAETGTTGRVVARRVAGGVVVNGVKSFNTGSGRAGQDLASVGVRLIEGTQDPAAAPPYRALVRLDAPGVRLAGDWDAMGQRSTISQTITYEDVFVADGWHFAPQPPSLLFLAFARCMHAAVLQGIGEGALTAAAQYVRELDRPSLPMFSSARQDLTLHRRLGEHASALAGTRAFVQRVAGDISTPGSDPLAAAIGGLQARVEATRSCLDAAQAVFELTGARSTSTRHRLDRFWRNARTLSAHDPLDASHAVIGRHLLTGELPPLADYFRAG